MKTFLSYLFLLVGLVSAVVIITFFVKPEIIDSFLSKIKPTQVDTSLKYSNDSVKTDETDKTASEKPEDKKVAMETSSFGSVSGKVCYPAGGIPPLTIYLKNTVTNEFIAKNNAMNVGSYEFDLVPAGSYYAFAYTQEQVAGNYIGGSYSPAVACGLTVSCTDHKPSKVVVGAGESIKGIDICDYYGEKSDVPAKP